MDEPRRRGLLVLPAANTTMEEEIRAACPELDLSVARVPSPPRGIAADLPGYRANTFAAVAPFVAARPEVLLFGCTAAGFYGGPEGNAAMMAELRAMTGARVVSTADAMVEILEHHGLHRVALVTPYAQDVNDRLVDYLAHSAIAVTTVNSFLCTTSAALLAITEAQLMELALATDTAGAEAIFIACSQMPTQRVLPALRERFGLPAWSSVSATAWAGSRVAALA